MTLPALRYSVPAKSRYPRVTYAPQTKPVPSAQAVADSGLVGMKLYEELLKIWESVEKLGSSETKAFLDQEIYATVWHGTRRRESIEELKKNGFCSYTKEQAVEWLKEARKLMCERDYIGPRFCKYLDRWERNILQEISNETYRGKFSVTGIEEAACGEDTPDDIDSGWGWRNPEFLWDYLYANYHLTPKKVDDILTVMFGKPVKVKLRLKLTVRHLLNPQDIHTEQRCFSPQEIVSIVPCPPKAKGAK